MVDVFRAKPASRERKGRGMVDCVFNLNTWRRCGFARGVRMSVGGSGLRLIDCGK